MMLIATANGGLFDPLLWTVCFAANELAKIFRQQPGLHHMMSVPGWLKSEPGCLPL